MEESIKKAISFLESKEGMVDWDDPDLDDDMIMYIHKAIPEYIRSYLKTETYMLVRE